MSRRALGAGVKNEKNVDRTGVAGNSGEQQRLSGHAASPCASAGSSHRSTSSHRSRSAASPSDGRALRGPAPADTQNQNCLS